MLTEKQTERIATTKQSINDLFIAQDLTYGEVKRVLWQLINEFKRKEEKYLNDSSIQVLKKINLHYGGKKMEKEKKKDTIITVERTNESLMQEDVVSEEEFKCFNGMGTIYGKKIVKTAQQIAKMLDGFTIEEANRTIDLARHGLKYTAVIKLNP